MHHYWTNDWLLNRKVAIARSRLLLARILSPAAQLPYRDGNPMPFHAAVTRCCTVAGADVRWLIDLWCSYLPSAEQAQWTLADRQGLFKIRRMPRPEPKVMTLSEQEPELEVHNAHDFTGIINHGATAYMNSLLQALYMTPELRLALYRWEWNEGRGESKDDSIPYQLQKV